MKKLLTLPVLLQLSLFLATPAFAYEDVYDQGQAQSNICYIANEQAYLNQTYQPSLNVLTKVMVKMNDRNGGNITLTVKDEVTGQNVLQKTQRMGLDDGWETFDLDWDSLGYVLDVDHLHSIWIGTDYSGRGAPCWLYTSSDLYTLGTRRSGSVEEDGDFTFSTFGYNIDMGRDNPEPEGETVIVVDEEVEDTGEDSTEGTSGSDTSNTTVTTINTGGSSDSAQDDNDTDQVVTIVNDIVGTVADDPVEKAEVATEEDSSITEPELGSVIVNEIVVEVTDDESVTTEDGDIVQITGTADAGDTVYVYIGDDTYSSVADDDGNWYVIIDTDTLDQSEYEVQAQAQKGDKSSSKVDLISLVIGETTTIVQSGKSGEDNDSNSNNVSKESSFVERLMSGDLSLYFVAGCLFLLILLILLLLWILKKKKEVKNKKSEKKEVKK